MSNSLLNEKNSRVIEAKVRDDLVEKTFTEIVNNGQHQLKKLYGEDSITEVLRSYENGKRKGGLGNLIEECYFGYRANSTQGADLKASGIEVKVTPYEKSEKGKISAGERLVITMISYSNPVEFNFYKSHVWEKIQKILLIYYLREKKLTNSLLYRIKYVNLFTPSKTDMEIILNDYNTIVSKVKNGKAHELSEADTSYLGACTKGATAEKSLVFQTCYAPTIKAKKRAFCYKNSYMTYVLNEYIVKEKNHAETIISDSSKLLNTTFDEYVLSLIDKNKGASDRELCERYALKYTDNKAQWNTLAFRMLGIKSNKAVEFEKANIVVKTIRLEENGKINEQMSLPPISLNKVAQESWEESSLYEYFCETKFLFVVFKKRSDNYVLMGAKFWNMPYVDLEEIVRTGWEKAKKIINEGIILRKKIQKKGLVICNNLPGIKDNPIVHLRPHASKRYYKLKDGEIIGDGTKAMAEELPDNQWMPKQSFWLNSSYIKSVISDLNKD